MIDHKSVEYETLLALVEKLENDKQNLKERIDNYNLLFDNSPLGVLIFNEDGSIVDINENLLDMLGSKSEEQTRQINMLTYPPFKLFGLSTKIKETLSTKKMISGTITYKTKWDKNVNLRYSMKAVEYRTKKLVIGIIEDITSEKDIEVIFTHNDEIQELNKEHRKIDKATDVLSFPLEFDMPNMPLGSIVISTDFVEDKAKEYEHTFNEELSLLFIHGLLHLLGYDHEVDNGEHRQKEEELINQFNLPKSLIIRNS